MGDKIYQTRIKKIKGGEDETIFKQAFALYKQISSKTKRRAHIRAAYFNKEKVFLDFFWHHIQEKNWQDRRRRLRYYACALDLIKNNRIPSITKINPNKRTEKLHRFSGMTVEEEIFYVQIAENLKTGEKHLISIFPENI